MGTPKDMRRRDPDEPAAPSWLHYGDKDWHSASGFMDWRRRPSRTTPEPVTPPKKSIGFSFEALEAGTRIASSARIR